MPDVIQCLRELRQSGHSSVVAGIEDRHCDDRPAIAHAIDEWLIDLILDQVTAPHGPALSLIVLAGNAGDGKSYLLRSVRQSLAEGEGLSPDMVCWLLDATESRGPRERSVDRLAEFLAPFRDSETWRPTCVHVVAMNTGAAVQFMDYARAVGDFHVLCDVLSVQLGIKGAADDGHANFWPRYDRVLVIDLDRRMLVPLVASPEDFVHTMLATLENETPQGLLSGASTNCEPCSCSALCPVRANLALLRLPRVRERLLMLLRDVTLEDRIHIGPRGLWHLVYQLTVGGLDTLASERGVARFACADIGSLRDEDRPRVLLYNAIFAAAGDAGGGAQLGLLGELARLDPVKRFSLSSFEHALAAEVSASEDARLAADCAEGTGLDHPVLAGHPTDALHRARSAVRRAFFLELSDPDSVRHDCLRDWAEHLSTHAGNVLQRAVTRDDRLTDLLVGALSQVYGVAGERNLWHLRLPWQPLTELLTQLDLRAGPRSLALDRRVLGPDCIRPDGMRDAACELARCAGAYPLGISIPLRQGPDVRITWPLYRLLRRVSDGHYVAASLDPERVQHLERIAESLGAYAAISNGVAVIGADRRLVHCVGDNAGGFDVVRG